MQALVIKLLTLIALAMMPFGMAAPAAAQPAGHHAAAAADVHCPDPAGDRDSQAPKSNECAMTCAAIVAPEFVASPAPALNPPPAVRPLAQRGSGLHPEAATPPPKRI
ncbi:hypothetical protein [Sphingomonas sp.]|uniref:hypothetical protein n=1 Tax=Sphingomonas sp. TaxID=28214 RepID=UPI00286DDD87|nr:hypothetical protein [Sphingomonas sp.]